MHILINRMQKEIQGLSMSSKNAKGMTPLMLAAEQGNCYIMELLFEIDGKQGVNDEGGGPAYTWQLKAAMSCV